MMSRKIAFGGILTALCVVMVYMAALLPSGKLGLYAISSLAIAAAVVELEIRWGALVYAASGLLIFLLTGNISALLLFSLFFGAYPLLKYYIEKQRSSVLEILMKLAAFNVLAAAGYFIYSGLMGVAPINAASLQPMLAAGLVLAAQLFFLIYDYVLSRLIDYYVNRIKSALKG